ncbi:hypothetical protein EV363DRAFT_1185876 [Boletus edulis]|nr:hypothetical protein EV363DRAFT_1185876 [Boletus edulis]
MSECRSAHIIPECMMKDWTSPVYAFFQPTPVIEEIGTRRSHVFKCCARGCKVTVRRYLDTTDARSTGNMRKHAKKCWGSEALKAADSAKNAVEVREKIVGSILHTGSITQSFERKGKGKVTYLHRQHTRTETKAEIVRWVCESLRPFAIVKDRGFQSLMKTGRPEYYIPSESTVSRDVRLVFARTRVRVAKMLKEYDGKLNFTTDAWTAPNHRALVAFSVHLEHKGTPLHFPLDVIEVAKVTYLGGA